VENRSCEPTGDEARFGINTELTGAGQGDGDEVETGNREIKATTFSGTIVPVVPRPDDEATTMVWESGREMTEDLSVVGCRL
jgi:hypothetical protein